MNLPKARINAYYDDKNKPIKNWVNAIWVAPNVKEEEKNYMYGEDGKPVGIVHVHDCMRAGVV